MKCINKMRLLCLCGIAAVFMSGCGQTVVSYDNPYDIYSTSADYGLASEGAGSEKTYFSQNLCVADDVNIGNDTTDSQVAEGASTHPYRVPYRIRFPALRLRKSPAGGTDRKSTRLNSSHSQQSRMPSSA